VIVGYQEELVSLYDTVWDVSWHRQGLETFWNSCNLAEAGLEKQASELHNFGTSFNDLVTGVPPQSYMERLHGIAAPPD
jgi:hypothetical protein